MKFLVIQENGHHSQNRHLRECFSLQRAIESLGHICDVIGPGHTTEQKHDEYDVMLLIEQYTKQGLPDTKNIKARHKVQWIIDLHCQGPEFYLEIGKDCTTVLHSTRSLIYKYAKWSPYQLHKWWPNAFDDFYFKGQGITTEKVIDIGFIGSNIAERTDFIKRLNLPIYTDFRLGNEMIDLICRMKMHFNRNISVDINYRNFETMGLGVCLLTNAVQEMDELGFVHGTNCLMYRNAEECEQLFKEYIRDNKWKQIAYNGYEFSKKHTYKERIKLLLEMLGES